MRSLTYSNYLPAQMPPVVIIVVLLFALVYLGPIILIFHNPYSYHFSHGILILGIISYMLWEKRKSLKNIPVNPDIIPSVAVLILGSVVLWAGKYTETPVVEGTALVVGVAGMVLLLLGAGYFKALLFPIFYLNFLFPIFDKILAGYSTYFERTAAFLGSLFLKLVGIPLIQQGQIIELPHIVLKVGQACNGINHIIALVALVIFWGYLRNFSLFNMGLSIVIAAAAGILANGLRVGLIGLWTKYFGTESFHGPFDIFYSTFVFLAGIIILVLILPKLQRKEAIKTIQEPVARTAGLEDEGVVKKRMTWASGFAFVVLVPSLLMLSFIRPAVVTVDRDLLGFPLTVAGWQGEDVARLGEPFEQAADYDSVLRRVYRDSQGNDVNLFIGYLNSQRKNREIHQTPKAIQLEYASNMEVGAGTSAAFNVRGVEYHSGSATRKAVYFYHVNGRIIGSRYMAKIASMLYGIIHQKTDAAIIMVSFRKDGGTGSTDENAVKNFVVELIPAVRIFMMEKPSVVSGLTVSGIKKKQAG